MKKFLLLHVSFILTFLTITVPLRKARVITLRCLLHLFSKHFLHRQQNRYVKVTILTNSLNLM